MEFPFQHQYDLVRGARAALLDHCAQMRPEHVVAPVGAFNHSCIRDLLVHSAGAYLVWLGEVGLSRTVPRTPPAAVPDVAALRRLFGEVDALVADFEVHFSGRWLEATEFQVARHPVPLQLSPLQLFTHVITHEFHHKGQVLSMSRQLGYAPADTDIIRF